MRTPGTRCSLWSALRRSRMAAGGLGAPACCPARNGARPGRLVSDPSHWRCWRSVGRWTAAGSSRRLSRCCASGTATRGPRAHVDRSKRSSSRPTSPCADKLGTSRRTRDGVIAVATSIRPGTGPALPRRTRRVARRSGCDDQALPHRRFLTELLTNPLARYDIPPNAAVSSGSRLARTRHNRHNMEGGGRRWADS